MRNTILLIALAFASCNTPEAPTSTDDRKEQLIASIDSVEVVFDNNPEQLTDSMTAKLLRNYLEFTRTYVADERTPRYLYKAAALCRGVQLPGKAITLYERIVKEYPDYAKRDEAAFLIGFTYDADLSQSSEAAKAYQAVIDSFPSSPWAEQARARLETVNMSDEELLQFLKAKSGEETSVN